MFLHTINSAWYNLPMLSLEEDKELVLKTKQVLSLMAKGMSLSDAMIETNYQTVLKNSPGAVSKTDAWNLVLNKYMPDDYLGQKHRMLLEKVDRNGDIDTAAVTKGLEMAYKLKGRFVERVDMTTNGKALPASIVFNFDKGQQDIKDTEVVSDDVLDENVLDAELVDNENQNESATSN